MVKKIIILIIVFLICSIRLLAFLKNKSDSKFIFHYEWNILSTNNNTIVHNIFSWQYDNHQEYTISHNIDITDNQKDIMNITLNQTKKQSYQSIILQDYTITTWQWNHRATIFEQEFLKKNKHKILPVIQNLSGIEYQYNYKKWLFIDISSLQWIYTNQFNQKNYYNIIIKMNCGISQYIKKKHKCNIEWEIILDLPINKYNKNWDIKWILYKEPIM